MCIRDSQYAVMKVRKDEMDVAIERREAKAKGAR